MGNEYREFEQGLTKAVNYFEQDIRSLRVGKANTALVEDIVVEAYGNTMALKGIASINVPDAKSIVVSPWDKGLVAAAEKAIRNSDLGLNPANMGDHIRIVIPPLTEERRKDLLKVVREKSEEAKVALRNLRHDYLNQVKKAKAAGDITEDEAFKAEEQANKTISKYNDQIEAIADRKQQEMMEI